MVEGAVVMPTHLVENRRRLRAVEMLVDVRGRKLVRNDANIGGDDTVGAMVPAQGRHKLRSDLPHRSGDENSPHINFPDCGARVRAGQLFQPTGVSTDGTFTYASQLHGATFALNFRA